jgi:molecular chaperone DnaK (HSP70)
MESAKTLEAGPAVGIDLGTTYSCVAVMTAEKIEIIPNEQGNNTMPSYVAFNKDQRLIGEAAKSQESRNTKNTVFDAKRLIGNHFSNPQVQKDMKHWGFKVKSAKTSDDPVIEVTVDGQ